MPTQVNCCTGSTQLSQGQYFEFVNLQTVECNITSCSPPLVNSSYLVPAAVGATGGTCQAQVQSNASPGTYNLSCDCCSPNNAPTLIVKS